MQVHSVGCQLGGYLQEYFDASDHRFYGGIVSQLRFGQVTGMLGGDPSNPLGELRQMIVVRVVNCQRPLEEAFPAILFEHDLPPTARRILYEIGKLSYGLKNYVTASKVRLLSIASAIWATRNELPSWPSPERYCDEVRGEVVIMRRHPDKLLYASERVVFGPMRGWVYVVDVDKQSQAAGDYFKT